MLEKEVNKSIRTCLNSWSISGVVVWWTRLQCGKIRVGAYYVQLCEKGTPDFLALVRAKTGGLAAVFIESKGHTGQLRPEQIKFQKEYSIKDGVYVLKISDVKELGKFIDNIGIDLVKDIEI